jgi:hypothetical protein
LADNGFDSRDSLAVKAENDLVQGYYQNFLGRPVDTPALSGCVSLLRQGGSDEQVLAVLLGSDEFFARL